MNEITQSEYTSELEHDGIPVVRLSVSVLHITEINAAVKRFNSFYAHIAKAAEKHLRKKLLPQAKKDFENALAGSRPFEPYRVKIVVEAARFEADDENTLTVRRRVYASLQNGSEREKILTERWNMRLGLPERIYDESPDYSFLVERDD